MQNNATDNLMIIAITLVGQHPFSVETAISLKQSINFEATSGLLQVDNGSEATTGAENRLKFSI